MYFYNKTEYRRAGEDFIVVYTTQKLGHNALKATEGKEFQSK